MFFCVSLSLHAAAVFYTDETLFNSDSSGFILTTEGFETPFTAGPIVIFNDLTITANNVSDLESRFDGENGGFPSTEGTRLARYFTLTPGEGSGGITIDFFQPTLAFSIDLIDVDAISNGNLNFSLSVTTNFGDSLVIVEGTQGNNSVNFIGVIDQTNPFTSVTIYSTQTQEGIGIDRIQYSPIPIPPAVWLFGSALIGLVCLKRKSS